MIDGMDFVLSNNLENVLPHLLLLKILYYKSDKYTYFSPQDLVNGTAGWTRTSRCRSQSPVPYLFGDGRMRKRNFGHFNIIELNFVKPKTPKYE